MDRTMEQRIRERAYEIWLANGSKDGEADRHWLTAERELLSEMSVTVAAEQQTGRARKSRRRTPTTAKPRVRVAS
jgi:hypothetical protein